MLVGVLYDGKMCVVRLPDEAVKLKTEDLEYMIGNVIGEPSEFQWMVLPGESKDTTNTAPLTIPAPAPTPGDTQHPNTTPATDTPVEPIQLR